MKFKDFTIEERTAIAEFVLAYENDVFLKSDGAKMINIFLAKEIISKEDSINLTSKLEKNINLSEELIEILFSNFEVKVGKSIMDEYAYNNFKQDN
jgi:hypothetical protein